MKEIVDAIKHLSNCIPNTGDVDVVSVYADNIYKLSKSLEILPDVDYDTTNVSAETIKEAHDDFLDAISSMSTLAAKKKSVAEEMNKLKDSQAKACEKSTTSPFIKPGTETPFDEAIEKPKTSKRKMTRWTTGELNLIHSVMLSTTAKSRQTYSYLAKKFPDRSEQSIKSKLHALGISVHKDKLIAGDDYEPPKL